MPLIVTGDRPAWADAGPDEPERTGADDRILDAALTCVARWGVKKTTLEDIARDAACSRATIYRAFPGGKESLFDALLRRELGAFLRRLGAALAAAGSVEDALVAGMVEAARTLQGSAPLQFLLAHEPETILPLLAFDRMDEVLAAGRAVAAPHLARWLDPVAAARAAEWAARIVISYTTCPADDVDMADPQSVRRLVRCFVLPGLSSVPEPRG